MSDKVWQIPFMKVWEQLKKKASTTEGRYELLLQQIESTASDIMQKESILKEKPDDWIYRDTFLQNIESNKKHLSVLLAYKEEYEATGYLDYLSLFND